MGRRTYGWLRERLASRGIRCAVPRQEDWGWYLLVEPQDGQKCSVSINVGWSGGEFGGRRIPAAEECWSVFVVAGGRGCLSWFFGTVDDSVKFGASIDRAIREVLATESGIELIPRPGTAPKGRS
jgi:hypothetical protein